MDFIHAVILGIVEGVTEYLPVSSTGHMIITSHLLHLTESEFLKTFEIAIQLGAIAAVFSLYWRTFLLDWEVGLKVMAAFLPTAVIGFVLYKLVKHFLLGNILVVALSLFIGGVVLIVFEKLYKGQEGSVDRLEHITYPQALIIGLCQSLAVVPGVSRSAATILSGLMLGITRKTIVEFSFLLAVPTITAAVVWDMIKSSSDIQGAQWGLLAVGFIVAFVVAWGSVKFLLRYIKRNDFVAFGVYRIIIAVVLLFLFFKSGIISK